MTGILAVAALGELVVIVFLTVLAALFYVGFRDRRDDAEQARTERDAARVDRDVAREKAELAREELAALSKQLILAELATVVLEAGGEDR
ncbi:hypothetical protein [Krasilnikovia sp. MM14-A1259]|uniref:hypothetical protein n=1 Tax=Krasilnikovia sp. MM14-A1259 TaxID=3373539 RepID=UPI003830B554